VRGKEKEKSSWVVHFYEVFRGLMRWVGVGFVLEVLEMAMVDAVGRRTQSVGRRKTKHDGRKGREGRVGRKKEGGFFYFLALLFLYVTFLSG
jgi:hypothetical protein